MIGVALASMMAAGAAGLPPCPPSEYGATVGAISAINGATRNGRTAVRTGRGSGSTTVFEGDILCGNELVTNPAGSGIRVTVNLPGGAEIPIGPGQQASIPMPGMITSLAARGRPVQPDVRTR